MCTWGLDSCQVEKQMTLKDTTSAQGEWRGDTYENRAYKLICTNTIQISLRISGSSKKYGLIEIGISGTKQSSVLGQQIVTGLQHGIL